MRSLTLLHRQRTSSPQNFGSLLQNDFCNSIGRRSDIGRLFFGRLNTPATPPLAHRSMRRCQHCATRHQSNDKQTARRTCPSCLRTVAPPPRHRLACQLRIQRVDERGWPSVKVACRNRWRSTGVSSSRCCRSKDRSRQRFPFPSHQPFCVCLQRWQVR
jgi:hypothetical protein